VSKKLRTFADILAIIILWFAILVVAGLSSLGDCFEPGCGEAMDRAMHLKLALVAFGFVAHLAGYFLLKARRARRD
jgi:hypothetical protein